jgi:hypothetical protein
MEGGVRSVLASTPTSAGGLVSIVSGFLGRHVSLTNAVTRDNALMSSDTDEAPAADPEPHAPVSA